MTGAPSEDRFAHAVEMRRLLYGHLLSAALRAAAILRLPDLLHEGCTSMDGLARRAQAYPPALRRLLRVLAAFDVVVEHPDGTFGLTPLGETLRSDVPGTALPTALLTAEICRAWDGLVDTVRTGTPAFNQMFGTDVFSYLAGKPELRAVFDASQAADLDISLDELRVINFSAYRTIVDVGGGDGALLAHVLSNHPGTRGVLLDTASVVPAARERMAAEGLSERCRIQAGDFFVAVPPGGDLYLLRDILHDWSDERCVQLLGACRRAMAPDSTLAVIERVADERGGPEAQLTGLMDLYMMSVVDGEERTHSQLVRLLERAGFRAHTCHRLRRGAEVILAGPAP